MEGGLTQDWGAWRVVRGRCHAVREVRSLIPISRQQGPLDTQQASSEVLEKVQRAMFQTQGILRHSRGTRRIIPYNGVILVAYQGELRTEEGDRLHGSMPKWLRMLHSLEARKWGESQGVCDSVPVPCMFPYQTPFCAPSRPGKCQKRPFLFLGAVKCLLTENARTGTMLQTPSFTNPSFSFHQI